MFEEEAKEYTHTKYCEKCSTGHCEKKCILVKDDYEAFKDGAEFGYNKANEWHYVNWKYFADKDCPKSELSSYLVQLKNKDLLICDWETEEGFGCFWDSNLNPIDNDDVSAWKEIVLPEEEKENEFHL